MQSVSAHPSRRTVAPTWGLCMCSEKHRTKTSTCGTHIMRTGTGWPYQRWARFVHSVCNSGTTHRIPWESTESNGKIRGPHDGTAIASTVLVHRALQRIYFCVHVLWPVVTRRRLCRLHTLKVAASSFEVSCPRCLTDDAHDLKLFVLSLPLRYRGAVNMNPRCASRYHAKQVAHRVPIP